MALQVFDGYDHYNSSADMQNRVGFVQYFTSFAGSSLSFGIGPFGLGRSVVCDPSAASNHALMQSIFQVRNSEAYIGKRVQWETGVGGWWWLINSLATPPQAAALVYFNPVNFSIQIYSGGHTNDSDPRTNAVLLATTNNNVWANNSWNFIEVGYKIDPSAGFLTVRVNGEQLVTFAGNTGSGTFDILQENSSSGGLVLLDDFYYCDGTTGPGSFPMNSFLGDVRAVTLFPVGDDVVTFTPIVTVGNLTISQNSNTVAATGNVVQFIPFVPNMTGPLQAAVTAGLAGVPGNAVLGLYDSDGTAGAPKTKLTQATAIVGPTVGDDIFTLAATPTLTAGHKYYWAVLGDLAFVFNANNGISETWYTAPLTYTTTLPADASVLTQSTVSQQAPRVFGGVVAPDNWQVVSENSMDSDQTYAYSNTLNNEDLYNVQALPPQINLVLGVQVTVAARKDDAGTRAMQTSLESGGTTYHDGTDHFLSVGTYNYYTGIWAVDPHTAASWTVLAVNGLAAGYKITV